MKLKDIIPIPDDENRHNKIRRKFRFRKNMRATRIPKITAVSSNQSGGISGNGLTDGPHK